MMPQDDLTRLPEPIKSDLLYLLPTIDLFSLSIVSRSWNRLIDQHELYLQYFHF